MVSHENIFYLIALRTKAIMQELAALPQSENCANSAVHRNGKI